MNVWPNAFEVGDVLNTGFGTARLEEMVGEDEKGRDTWRVHYLDLDIEMEHAFTDMAYTVVEVAK